MWVNIVQKFSKGDCDSNLAVMTRHLLNSDTDQRSGVSVPLIIKRRTHTFKGSAMYPFSDVLFFLSQWGSFSTINEPKPLQISKKKKLMY